MGAPCGQNSTNEGVITVRASHKRTFRCLLTSGFSDKSFIILGVRVGSLPYLQRHILHLIQHKNESVVEDFTTAAFIPHALTDAAATC